MYFCGVNGAAPRALYFVKQIFDYLDTDPLPIAGDPLSCLCSFVSLAVTPGFGAGSIIAIACAVVALFISGFISGSEIAYFSLTTEECGEIADTPVGKKIMRLLNMPERLLATILIANNLVNVTIVILLNFALGPVFSGMSAVMSFILQTVLLTFLILLFGEILPKLYANYNTLGWARMAAGGIGFFIRIFYPLSSMMVRSSAIVNKVVTKKQANITADDLSQALEITDLTTADDKEMLQGILDFGETTAAEVMTPRVDITDIDIRSSFDEVMKTIISSGYSRLPVYDETQDNIKGVLYSRDLLPFINSRQPADFNWQRLLREPYFVPESRMIDDLLEDFRRRRIHMAIVIDEFGGTQGIVTLEDVLEEIVGDINDEYDEEEKTYRRLPDSTYVFEGKTLLNDFFRVTGVDEEAYDDVTDDCETLAGMLLNIKGDFPKEKESVVYGRFRFLILDIDHHRIASVRVKVMPETTDAN